MADDYDELEAMVRRRVEQVNVPTVYRNNDNEEDDLAAPMDWRPARDPGTAFADRNNNNNNNNRGRRKRKDASVRSLFDLDAGDSDDMHMDVEAEDDDAATFWNIRQSKKRARNNATEHRAPNAGVRRSSNNATLRLTVDASAVSSINSTQPAWLTGEERPATTNLRRSLRKLGCKSVSDLHTVLNGLKSKKPTLLTDVLTRLSTVAKDQMSRWFRDGDVPATPVARMTYLGEVSLATEVIQTALDYYPDAGLEPGLRNDLVLCLQHFRPWFWLRMIDYENFCATGDFMPGVMGDADDADDGAIDAPQSTDPKIVVRCTHAWWLICLQGAMSVSSWMESIKRQSLRQMGETPRCSDPTLTSRDEWSALGAEALVPSSNPGYVLRGPVPPIPDWAEGREIADLDLDELSAILWRWSGDWKVLHWSCGMHSMIHAVGVQTARLFFTQPASGQSREDLPDAAYAERPSSFRLVSAISVARAHLMFLLTLSDAHHALVHAWKEEECPVQDAMTKARFHNNLWVMTQSGHVRGQLWTIYEKGILAFGASPAGFEYSAQSAGAAVGVGGRTAATALSNLMSDVDLAGLCGYLCTTDCPARHVIAESPELRDMSPDIRKQIPADVITLTDNLTKPMDPAPYRVECLYHLTRILTGMQRSRNADLGRIDTIQQNQPSSDSTEEGSGPTASCMWHENDRVLASLPESPDATLWLGPRNRTLETRIYGLLLGTEEEQPPERHPEGGCTVMWRFMGDFWICSPRRQRWARTPALPDALHLWWEWCEQDREARPCDQCQSACETVQTLFGEIKRSQ
jgi:hypothetical protein